MNPEFLRNVWLELTPRRMLLMLVVLALIFVAAGTAGGKSIAVSGAAVLFYYLIVVFWGTRNAALAVAGEIRERTWDAQRLSSLGAAQMSWAKLFGATIYNWFGGIVCLGVIFFAQLGSKGAAASALDCVHYLAVGVLAQAAALLASLIAVRRRREGHSRMDVFIYQIVGLFVAWIVHSVWTQVLRPSGALTISWWGTVLPAHAFLLISLAVFAAWTFAGCHRLMRVELRLENGPFIWLLFAVFMALYDAGFDGWFTNPQFGQYVPYWTLPAARLALAGATLGVLTYFAILLEPKDRVLYRWLGSALRSGQVLAVLARVQAWMTSYALTLAVGVALIVVCFTNGHSAHLGMASMAGLGFIARDIAIFLFFSALPGRRRGDWAAIVTLFALYILIPAILSGAHAKDALFFFYPQTGSTGWLAVAAAWIEAAVFWTLALSRLGRSEAKLVATIPVAA